TDAANDFTGAVSLNNSGANAVAVTDVNALILGASTVGDDLTVTAASLTISAGATVASSGGGDITLLTDALQVGIGGTINAGAGNITLSTVTLAHDIEVCGGASCVGIPTFDASYDLANLAVTAASFTVGRATHTGAITMQALTFGFPLTVVNGGTGSISVVGDYDGTGSLALTSGSGGIDLGANVTTSTTQTYTGAVTLSGGARTLAGSTVQFVAGVAGGTNDLTITGNLDLDGAATGLGFLSVSGTSNLGANVTTATTQTYTGAVTLSGGNRTLAGTTINFGSTLDGGAAALTVTGNLDLNGAATNLTTLSVSGTSNLGGNVTSTGTQTYSGATTLSGGARTLTASTVNFGSTLDGGNDALTITGNLDLDGAATNLTTLSVSGTSDIGGNVTTTGTQSYGNVVLTANATFTTTDSAVTFGGTVDSDGTPRAFSVVAGTGQIDIVGNIGGISPMASIYLGTTGDAILGGSATTGSFQTNAGGTTYLGGDITATGFIQFSDAVVLTADVTLATSGTAGLYVMSTIDSDGTPRNLVLSITGVTGELALTSNIGATSALASLTASAIDMLTIGGNVTTTGAQSYS
ncbi:MAG: hypothetical protein LC650_02955, partial [Actinobacteria bacterium]|nr:hypothetical protein [Actinomycetota bacterium]